MTVISAGSTSRKGPRANSPATRTLPFVVALSEKEAWDLFDAQARELLGMSGEEFERAWDEGAFRERQEDPAVRRVIMIRPDRSPAE